MKCTNCGAGEFEVWIKFHSNLKSVQGNENSSLLGSKLFDEMPAFVEPNTIFCSNCKYMAYIQRNEEQWLDHEWLKDHRDIKIKYKKAQHQSLNQMLSKLKVEDLIKILSESKEE